VSRVGAVDCGTNSIRLLVADVGSDGRLTDVLRRMEIVRLGHGVDRTGVIDASAMARTLAMTREYAAACREAEVERVRFVATSASRDASNAMTFVEGVREAFGAYAVSPEVVTGEEEAALSFAGATGDLVAEDLPSPYLVVDLGGGSTEVVRGTDHADGAVSVDVGCVRMTERHLRGDPPTDAEIASAAADIDSAVIRAREAVGFAGVGTVVGLAGSITTITAYVLGLAAYDPRRIHLARLTAEQHERGSAELLGMSRAERAALPFMHPGRVDIIGAGALVWRQLLGAVLADSPSAQVVTSEHDILDGIALSVAGG
jgi:exopolyphosphatase/guanosine-5'-triphosphate,3'-diphosphate pyrophosphatase